MLKFRHLIASLIMGSLLLTQLAVAAYVCPAQTNASQMMAMQMEDCDGIDTMQPALCHALADSSFDQSLPDQAAHTDIPPFIFLGWAQVVHPVQLTSILFPCASESTALKRLHAPPLRVLHCSFLH